MGKTWQESLEQNFEDEITKYIREGCSKECQQQCLNQKPEERMKKAIDIAYHFCITTSPNDPNYIKECEKERQYQLKLKLKK